MRWGQKCRNAALDIDNAKLLPQYKKLNTTLPDIEEKIIYHSKNYHLGQLRISVCRLGNLVYYGHMVKRVKLGFFRRFRGSFFLLPALLSPISSIRIFFHRLRGAKIESDVEIGYFVMIDNLYPHLVRIRKGATVGYGCTIVAHDDSRLYARDGEEVVRHVESGEKAFLGVHSIVLPGVTIGARTIVGAGSLINKNVDPDSVVAGIPFRYIERKG